MKQFCMTAAVLGLSLLSGAAQTDGGISPQMMTKIKSFYAGTPTDRALRNAIVGTDISRLAVNADNRVAVDTHFSHSVPGRGITNQKSSGRCWLFTGLNVLRAKVIAKYDMGDFQFSQTYVFFWDQLEKSNLFLQGVIDTRKRPMDDKMVEWLFKNPLSDGGQYTGIADLLTKYGVVPLDVMPETNSSENTRVMSSLISLKLREYGLKLREMSAAKSTTPEALQEAKTEMLGTIYRILALNLGEPPTQFVWTRRDANGNPAETKEYTPHSFYDQYVADDLQHNYVMLMNDPTREYYKLYEIDFDRHTYDGSNWTYVNLPVDDIKQMAIASIKDSTMMYFSCDVGKCFDRTRGLLDTDNYDYESLLGTAFGMDKRQRVATFASGSSHAMTLMAVDLDADGRPRKWKVENSWGSGPNDGHLIMTDKWFDEYMFRLVINRKYLTDKAAAVLSQKPVLLPAWDPMFADEQ